MERPEIGTSKAVIKEALKNQGFAFQEKSASIMALTSDFNVHVPEMEKPFPFKVELIFGDKGLTKIDLNFDMQAMFHVTTNVITITDVVANDMRNALTAKYGKPAQASTMCEAPGSILLASHDHVECASEWQDSGQLIRVHWWYDRVPASFTYPLSYEQASPDI